MISRWIQWVFLVFTSQAIAPAEQALGKFTHRKLKNIDSWDTWFAGERKNSINFMIYKYLVNLSFLLSRTIQSLDIFFMCGTFDSTKFSCCCCWEKLLPFWRWHKGPFAHSPSPEVNTFMIINRQYFEWHLDKFGKRLDQSCVLPVICALHSHPESGKLWE